MAYKIAKREKIAFMAYVPHHIHEAWAESMCDHSYKYTFNRLFNGKNVNFLGNSTIINQAASLLKGIFIPHHNTYLCEGPATMTPILLKKRFNKNIKIILINSDNFFYGIEKSKKTSRLYQEYLKNIDGIISTSHYMKEQAEKFIKVPHKVVYPWVDIQKFAKVKPNLKSKTIGFFAAAIRDKGADIMIDAANVLREKNKDYKLRIVGRIGEKINYGLGTEIIGFVPPQDMPEQFSMIGSYVNPARHEPFGVNILESMYCGIPPIVTKNCGAKEIVGKVSRKLIVRSDSKEIAGRILWLDSDMSQKMKLGKKCRKIAAEYTKERSMKDFEKRFKELLDEI